MHTLKICPDLVPDAAIAKVLAVAVSGLFIVNPDLLFAVALLFVLNALTTFWLAYTRDRGSYRGLVISTVQRFVGYTIAGVTIVLFSTIAGDLEFVRRFFFAGVGGLEAAVTLGMIARIVPRFKPLYLAVLRWLDKNTPIDAKAEEVNDMIDAE